MGFSLCIRPTKSSSRMASASRIARFLVSHTQFYMGFALCIARSLASHTQFFMGFALFTAGSLVSLDLISLAFSHRIHP
ncbi:hypothetical protein BDD12DRAFT_816875, partial [Trichophaea hybrida]